MVESSSLLSKVQIEFEYFNEDAYQLQTSCSIELTLKGNFATLFHNSFPTLPRKLGNPNCASIGFRLVIDED